MIYTDDKNPYHLCQKCEYSHSYRPVEDGICFKNSKYPQQCEFFTTWKEGYEAAMDEAAKEAAKREREHAQAWKDRIPG